MANQIDRGMDYETEVAARIIIHRAWLPTRLFDGTWCWFRTRVVEFQVCYIDGIWNSGVWVTKHRRRATAEDLP